jgi:hypothetical protein
MTVAQEQTIKSRPQLGPIMIDQMHKDLRYTLSGISLLGFRRLVYWLAGWNGAQWLTEFGGLKQP